MLAFLLGRKISHDMFSLLLVRVLWHMMFAPIFVGQENIVCYVIILLYWGVLANDVGQCSHLRWARTHSMTCGPCFLLGFWQMVFASACIDAGQGKIESHILVVVCWGFSASDV